MAKKEECGNCIHFRPNDKDGVNSKKRKCTERDNYYYPDEKACKYYEEK